MIVEVSYKKEEDAKKDKFNNVVNYDSKDEKLIKLKYLNGNVTQISKDTVRKIYIKSQKGKDRGKDDTLGQ